MPSENPGAHAGMDTLDQTAHETPSQGSQYFLAGFGVPFGTGSDVLLVQILMGLQTLFRPGLKAFISLVLVQQTKPFQTWQPQ